MFKQAEKHIGDTCRDNGCLLSGQKQRLGGGRYHFKVKGEVLIGGTQSLGDRPISSHAKALLWLMEGFWLWVIQPLETQANGIVIACKSPGNLIT